MSNVMLYTYVFGLIFSLNLYLSFCHQANTDKTARKSIAKNSANVTAKTTAAKPSVKFPLDSLTTINIGGYLVDIQMPSAQKKVKGNIVVLPGWSFSRQDWCKNSSLCRKALAQGYCLILPEMGKSIYASQEYPQTRKDWRNFPTRTWVKKQMIPFLQKYYGILLPEQRNFLVGLSTGARGVALLAVDMPELFKAGAALSGDYEQTQMPLDNLMVGFYGAYTQFPERWKGEDNPCLQVKKLKVPLYLGHGTKDNISPMQQTQLFYDSIKKNLPQLKAKLHLTEAAHDYRYWDSEVDNMLQFFEDF